MSLRCSGACYSLSRLPIAQHLERVAQYAGASSALGPCRTAAWQLDAAEKENCKDDVLALEAVRFRRRSTGSAKLSGVA